MAFTKTLASATSTATERGEGEHRALGRAVRGMKRTEAANAGDRRDVDDLPGLLRLHQLERFARAVEDAVDIDAPVFVPFLVGEILRHAERSLRDRRRHHLIEARTCRLIGFAFLHERGVVHENVQGAEAVRDLGEHLPHAGA